MAENRWLKNLGTYLEYVFSNVRTYNLHIHNFCKEDADFSMNLCYRKEERAIATNFLCMVLSFVNFKEWARWIWLYGCTLECSRDTPCIVFKVPLNGLHKQGSLEEANNIFQITLDKGLVTNDNT